MTDPVDALVELAAGAAPAAPDGPHLSSDELTAVRRTEGDDPSLDEAHRHLASCAACRARLSESSAAVRALVESASGDATRDAAQAPLAAAALSRTSFRALRNPGMRRWLAAAALAASVALVWTIASERAHESSATLVQRSYVGVLGDTSSRPPQIGPADEDIELAVHGESLEAASVLIADADGTIVAPWLTLRPGASGLRGVVAPRTFGPHRGALYALVVYGDSVAVKNAVASFPARAGAPGAEGLHDLRAALERKADGAHAALLFEELRSP